VNPFILFTRTTLCDREIFFFFSPILARILHPSFFVFLVVLVFFFRAWQIPFFRFPPSLFSSALFVSFFFLTTPTDLFGNIRNPSRAFPCLSSRRVSGDLFLFLCFLEQRAASFCLSSVFSTCSPSFTNAFGWLLPPPHLVCGVRPSFASLLFCSSLTCKVFLGSCSFM